MSFSPSLDWLFIIASAVLGLAVGSFLNVVIYRMPRGYLLGLPRRSICVSCKSQLRFWENIPILSYLFLLGRCSHCKAPIGARHPLVELLTAILFVAVYLYFGVGFLFLYYAFFVSALIAVTFIDLDFRLIPDKISYPGMFVGVFGAYMMPELVLSSHLLGFVLGGGIFWAFSYFYFKITNREGLGFGDVKLLAMIGAFLGIRGALGTLFISSIVGSIVGLSLMLIKRQNLRMAIPFGPFLALGALIMLFWGDYFAFRLYPVN